MLNVSNHKEPQGRHKEVPLTCTLFTDNDGKYPVIMIDEHISELITEIWIAGIRTTSCCESDVEHNDDIHIQFISRDYIKFMTIIADYDDARDENDTFLYHKIDNDIGFTTRFNLIDDNMPVMDFWDDFKDQKFKHYCNMEINCNLYFNKIYYEQVLQKMIKYNKTKKEKELYEYLTFDHF
ncbi:MAG TPA: hypothetical protein VLG50_05280 [Candidatus Saccharimonadales bacterium]|nr:hypothetical protein [Candidatus Saccharimonadales bacterium]